MKDQRKGGAVNPELVRTAARGIVQTMDTIRLSEYGGHATLSVAWANSLELCIKERI